MRKQFSGGVLLAVSVAGVGAAATGARPGLAASAATWRAQLATDPTGAVGLAASTLLWLLIGLIAVGVITTVLGRLPGAAGACCDALSRRLLPAAMRRGLHLMIGVAVGVTALAPSGAWAADVAFVRPAVSVTAPAEVLPNPLPSLGEPGGPVTMPTATAPPPQVAATPSTPAGTPGTQRPTAGPPSAEPPARQEVPTPAATRPATVTAHPASPGTDTAMAGALGDTSPPDAVPPTGQAAVVSVRPGDSLWVLAARELARRDGGAAPTDAAIAAEWPRWWAANRAAIGTDANLLTPGQRLAPPA